MDQHLFSLSPVDGDLDAFKDICITSSVALHILVYVSLGTCVSISPGDIPRSGIAGSRALGIFYFIVNRQVVLQRGCANVLATGSASGFAFPRSSPSFLLLPLWGEEHGTSLSELHASPDHREEKHTLMLRAIVLLHPWVTCSYLLLFAYWLVFLFFIFRDFWYIPDTNPFLTVHITNISSVCRPFFLFLWCLFSYRSFNISI